MINNSNFNRQKTFYKLETISGNIVDVVNNQIYPANIEIKDGKIFKIEKVNQKFDNFIIPGFIDSHIHIESSMLTPSEFARAAVVSGTVSVVADPHEIANVLGIKGVDFMISNGKQVPFKFYFGVPSCVPVTSNETAGAVIGLAEVKELLQRDDVKCLGEVMDFPAVIAENEEVLAKIQAAKSFEKPIDGHAPNVRADGLKKYISAGISTDHECYTKEEALEKISLGMKILIREGSAAKDFDALSSLIDEYPDSCMLSSDDKHPNDLVEGHINLLVKKALSLGYDKMKVLKCACVNPVKHYKLDVGLLQEGDSADFLQIDNFKELNVLKTVIKGLVVSENGWSLVPKVQVECINNFDTVLKNEEEFSVNATGNKINIIEAKDGLLITQRLYLEPKTENGLIISDTQSDILKITVVNRYKNSPPSVAFVKGFGFKKGAIASSVAHDSHNLIAVGVNDADIAKAVNCVIKNKGGLCVVSGDSEMILPLPIAGLMSDNGAFDVAQKYKILEDETKKMGSILTDPFMTLSFMTLLVIPELKLSDKGLFDSKNFKFVNLDENY